MNNNTFWKLIEQCYSDDADEHNENLKSLLVKLDAEEVSTFQDIFTQCRVAAYRWDLWAIAYIIRGGCSDDSFIDFCSMLIRKGQEFFHAMLEKPEETAISFDIQEDDFEDMFGYGIAEAYEELTDQQLPPSKLNYPDKPAGDEWNEEDLDKLYPNLTKKHESET